MFLGPSNLNSYFFRKELCHITLLNSCCAYNIIMMTCTDTAYQALNTSKGKSLHKIETKFVMGEENYSKAHRVHLKMTMQNEFSHNMHGAGYG